MTHSQVLARCRVYFVAVLVGLARGQTANDTIQAEVESPKLISVQTRTGPLADVRLDFDVRFTNRSENKVEIPEPTTAPDGAAWITLRWVQSKESDGTWSFVVSPGMLVWLSNAKFARCRSLAPQETVEMRLSQRLSVYKGELAELIPGSTVRAGIGVTCKRQDGTLLSKTVTTEPFVLIFPAQ